MTKAQIKKLETILAKLESLQNEVGGAAGEQMLTAKNELLRVLSTHDR